MEDCDDINLTERVCDFWCDNEWDREKLCCLLPQEIVDAICVIPIARAGVMDKLIWNATTDGKFSVKSAYLLNFAEQPFIPYPWFKNWSLCVPPKFKIFLWSVVAGKLMTNHQRVCRKFSNDPSCPHCPGKSETLLHLLRDCPKAATIWSAFNIPVGLIASFNLNLQTWLAVNLAQQNFLCGHIPWNILFIFCCWHLWKWRCKSVFDRSFLLPFNAKKIIVDCIEEWLIAAKSVKARHADVEVMLHWAKPPPGLYKLNVDGSRDCHGAIGAGGVLRDSSGGWCCGFMASLGVGEVLQAEAWGLFYGLQMAGQLGAVNVLCETDSAVLVNLVLNADVEVHPLGTIIRNCRDLMEQFPSCGLVHVLREKNGVADILAKSSLGLERGLHSLKHMPMIVAEQMGQDAAGVATMRRMVSPPMQGSAENDLGRCSHYAADEDGQASLEEVWLHGDSVAAKDGEHGMAGQPGGIEPHADVLGHASAGRCEGLCRQMGSSTDAVLRRSPVMEEKADEDPD